MLVNNDLSELFDIQVKYKDDDSLNKMHELMKSEFCQKSKNNKLQLEEEKGMVEYIKESAKLQGDKDMEAIKEMAKDIDRNEEDGNLNNKIRILHVSDFHMVDCGNKYYNDMKNILAMLMAQIPIDFKEKIDFICITGDVAQSGQASEYKNFEECFIDGINALMKENININDRILVVPGNHDFYRSYIGQDFKKDDWSNVKDIQNMMASARLSINDMPAEEWKNQILKKFETYKQFEKNYIDPQLYIDGGTGFSYFKKYIINNISIGFVGLNSAWSYGKESIGEDEKLFLGFEQYEKLKIKYMKELNETDVKVLLVHHPCCLLEEEIEILKRDFNFILNGHRHVNHMETNIEQGMAIEMTGGAMYFKEGEEYKYPYKFHLIDIEKSKTHLDYNIINYVWDTEERQWIQDDFTTPLLHRNKGVLKHSIRIT